MSPSGRDGSTRDPIFVYSSSSPAQDKPELFRALDALALAEQWSPAVTNEIILILEEWITNVISYSLSEVEGGTLKVEITPAGADLLIAVEDNGPAYNPLLADEPPLHTPPEERAIGGLGLFMMKKIAQHLEYQRVGDKNVLRIQKSLHRPVLSR